MSRPRYNIRDIVRVPRDKWSSISVVKGDHAPGHVFLFGEAGNCGGLLKLNRSDYLTVTYEELYLQEPARWPESTTEFIIVKDKIEFNSRPGRKNSIKVE